MGAISFIMSFVEKSYNKLLMKSKLRKKTFSHININRKMLASNLRFNKKNHLK